MQDQSVGISAWGFMEAEAARRRAEKERSEEEARLLAERKKHDERRKLEEAKRQRCTLSLSRLTYGLSRVDVCLAVCVPLQAAALVQQPTARQARGG